jgi:thiamine-phosphate pyrophosphorylase
MGLYYITDRRQLRGDLLEVIGRAVQAGIDLVQIREKDLAARELLELARAAAALVRGSATRILVNARADVALAAGAHGVHLPANSVPPADIRKLAPSGFLVGVSCHSEEEVLGAAQEGADFAVFGPVFETPSKSKYGPPQGAAKLRQACRVSGMPVYALGGVNLSNAAECFAAGATGIAAISLFQQNADLEAVVAAIAEARRGVGR